VIYKVNVFRNNKVCFADLSSSICNILVQRIAPLIIVEVFDGLVLTTEGKLTTFAAWSLAFLGVGLAIAIYKSLCRKAG
jgi:hypothetical protein